MTGDLPDQPAPPRDSQIVTQPAAELSQPLLFSDLKEEALQKLEATGEFTGERLAERQAGKYQLIVELITEGTLSEAQIAKAVRVSRNTVSAVRKRQGIPIEQVKERIKRNVREALLATSERVLELAPTMNARDAIIATGVLAEKDALLNGDATVIVRHENEKAKHADFNSLLDALPTANAHVVEPMGSPGEPPAQKGASDLALSDGSADWESVVSSGDEAGSNGQRNNTPAEPPVSGGSEIEGGRGSAEGEGGK